MCVSVVRVEHLSLAHLLQRGACLQYDLDWHFVEYLFLVLVVVAEVQHRLNTADSACFVSPFVDGLGDLLDRSPVHEYPIFTLGSELAKLVGSHPRANLLQRIHRELTVDCWIGTDFRRVKLAKRDGVESL